MRSNTGDVICVMILTKIPKFIVDIQINKFVSTNRTILTLNIFCWVCNRCPSDYVKLSNFDYIKFKEELIYQ